MPEITAEAESFHLQNQIDPDCAEPALSDACQYLVNTGDVDANGCPEYDKREHMQGDECTTETGKAGTYDENCKCIPNDCEKPEEPACAKYEKTGDFYENGCPKYSTSCKEGTSCKLSDGTDGVCSKCECVETTDSEKVNCFTCLDDSPFYYNGACHACPAGMKEEGDLCVISVGRVSPRTVGTTCNKIWEGARLPLSCKNELGYAFVGEYGEECHPANTCAAICVVSPEQTTPDTYCQCENGGDYDDETKTCIYPECLGNAYRKSSGECQECPDITTIFNEGVFVEGNGNKGCYCPLVWHNGVCYPKADFCHEGFKNQLTSEEDLAKHKELCS